MTENWRIQISPKTADGTLINLRAETLEEAVQILEWATTNASLITTAAAQFTGVSAVTAVFPGAQVQPTEPQQWQQPQAAPPAFVQQPAPQAQAGRVCAHGAMQYREAKPGSGKDWRAYFCPTPQGTPNQCAAVFLKKGES